MRTEAVRSLGTEAQNSSIVISAVFYLSNQIIGHLKFKGWDNIDLRAASLGEGQSDIAKVHRDGIKSCGHLCR